MRTIMIISSFLLLLVNTKGAMAMELLSSAFSNGSSIPKIYTCDGKDISPDLQWSHVPEDAQSFVLIVDDPDAPMGTWDHWVLFNLPSNARDLKENVQNLPEGTRVGQNSWRRTDYGGPCPPDREHRYFFKLYALDKKLDLPTGASKKEIETEMSGHVLSEASLMGLYDRQ